ncbi:endonuclease domain-containing protein [Microbacterium suaedae]|uniref:endonuclease domain-containing protein n=1 Tax=Microbacterium suaedae TaxID=2067813 RepID=UPI000DA148AE|nr:DUF559 domain-containing protein [Microbacterium suaedae]
MQRKPLPPSLHRAFTVADAASVGVPPSRLRAHDLESPFHGTRSRDPVEDLPTRLRILLSALPEHAFVAGPTAALTWDLPLPLPLARKAESRLCIGVPARENRIRRPGVRGRALQLDSEDVVLRHGIRVTTPERTWVDVSEELSLPRLVAVTDRLLREGVSRRDLDRANDRAGRRKPGRQRRERALGLGDARSESPKESQLRVLFHDARLPRPELNVNIHDGSRFVARVDMLFRREKLVVEYQGDYHRDAAQWRRDEMRRAELESLGYRVTYVTEADFDFPERLVARIRRLLATS